MNRKNRNYYHYTIFQHFRSIVATRVVKKETDLIPNVKTCVWFSTNPSWENTVMKALRDPVTGEEEPYYSREAFFNCDYWNEFIGPGELHNFIPVRLKLNNEYINLGSNRTGAVNLRTWNNYKKNSGLSRESLKRLEKVGKKQGANPKEWFVSYKEVHLGFFIETERWDGKKWVELTIDDLYVSYPLITAA